MPMLCFLPWATITDRLRFGPFHLVPCGDAIAAGDIPTDSRDAVAAVLTLYGYRRAVDHASIPLLRHDTVAFLADLNDDQIGEYFTFRTRLTFAALAARQFFGFNYWNSDNLRLVIQGFTPGRAGATAITSRRRDGQTVNLIPRGSRVTTRPDHVSGACELPRDLDVALLGALEQAHIANDDIWPRIAEAMRLFVGANTDSHDVGRHSELVDTVSALSRLFDAWDSKGTLRGLLATLPSPAESDASNYGPKAKAERVRKSLEDGLPVRAAWLSDAYVLRSQYGHGRVNDPPYDPTWTEREHLLLGAVIVPLVVKSMLVRGGYYAFTDEDEALNNAFDTLATLEPFAERARDADPYPWRETLNRARLWPLIRAMARHLEEQIARDAETGE